ncbi:hypothetical protein FOA52_006906 [Chlamydomonas sp. UWO 241]|nr:hypothetical protein FOA52_006906 [Chlamydomonas sp. UWO 241]
MLGSDYRILAKVLATRWTPLLSAVVGPEQTAFLAGRRISDNICLTQMLPGLLAANAADGVGPTGAALALLDFRKAYDTIDRGFLIAVMEAVGVGDGVLAWTRTILTHTYASAEVNGFISAPRKYAAGVRQGCPAAPALFLFLGHALACFLRTCPAVGVEVVPGCRVTCPQYADDRMPLLRSCAPADVAALVETMAVFGRATGLVLNLGKCGILPLGSAGEGLLAGAEVAGLRVLDAGVSLGLPVSAGLPPPEGVTGVCRERLAAAYTKLARFPMSAFGRGHAAATYGVSRILFRAVHCGMTPEAERVLSRWTATLVDRSVGPDPPAELPRWASSVPGLAGLRGLEAAVPTLWRMPLLNARKEPIWRLWPAVEPSGQQLSGLAAEMPHGLLQPDMGLSGQQQLQQHEAAGPRQQLSGGKVQQPSRLAAELPHKLPHPAVGPSGQQPSGLAAELPHDLLQPAVGPSGQQPSGFDAELPHDLLQPDVGPSGQQLSGLAAELPYELPQPDVGPSGQQPSGLAVELPYDLPHPAAGPSGQQPSELAAELPHDLLQPAVGPSGQQPSGLDAELPHDLLQPDVGPSGQQPSGLAAELPHGLLQPVVGLSEQQQLQQHGAAGPRQQQQQLSGGKVQQPSGLAAELPHELPQPDVGPSGQQQQPQQHETTGPRQQQQLSGGVREGKVQQEVEEDEEAETKARRQRAEEHMAGPQQRAAGPLPRGANNASDSPTEEHLGRMGLCETPCASSVRSREERGRGPGGASPRGGGGAGSGGASDAEEDAGEASSEAAHLQAAAIAAATAAAAAAVAEHGRGAPRIGLHSHTASPQGDQAGGDGGDDDGSLEELAASTMLALGKDAAARSAAAAAAFAAAAAAAAASAVVRDAAGSGRAGRPARVVKPNRLHERYDDELMLPKGRRHAQGGGSVFPGHARDVRGVYCGSKHALGDAAPSSLKRSHKAGASASASHGMSSSGVRYGSLSDAPAAPGPYDHVRYTPVSPGPPARYLPGQPGAVVQPQATQRELPLLPPHQQALRDAERQRAAEAAVAMWGPGALPGGLHLGHKPQQQQQHLLQQHQQQHAGLGMGGLQLHPHQHPYPHQILDPHQHQQMWHQQLHGGGGGAGMHAPYMVLQQGPGGQLVHAPPGMHPHALTPMFTQHHQFAPPQQQQQQLQTIKVMKVEEVVMYDIDTKCDVHVYLVH